MSHVVYLRLDGGLATFDPEDPDTLIYEGKPQPVRLRSEEELLRSDPGDLEPIPTLPAPERLLRSADGSWVLHVRRKHFFQTYDRSDPRRGRKYAQISLDEASLWLDRRNIPMPAALVRDIRYVTKPEDPGESAKPLTPTKTKRRGRTAGVDKIGMAITTLSRRLKDGEPTTFTAIAKEAGCHRTNLTRSKKFMDAYGELTAGMKRAVRHRGYKEDGTLEGWTDPRGDRDDGDGDL
jgi:hypothetical protein